MCSRVYNWRHTFITVGSINGSGPLDTKSVPEAMFKKNMKDGYTRQQYGIKTTVLGIGDHIIWYVYAAILRN